MEDWNNQKGIGFPNTFFYQAKTDLINSRFSTAIVNLQTSFEIFINKALRNIYLALGIEQNKIERLLEQVSFKNKVTQELKKAIKDENYSQANTEYLNWKKYLYDERNAIIHRGFQVAHKDYAYNELKAYCEFHNYITKELLNRGIIGQRTELNFGSLQKDVDDDELRRKIEQGIVKETDLF